jgi:hypothetical protein
MGKRMPETFWAVFERQAINLRDWCIWLVDLFECTSQLFCAHTEKASDFCTKKNTRLLEARMWLHSRLFLVFPYPNCSSYFCECFCFVPHLFILVLLCHFRVFEERQIGLVEWEHRQQSLNIKSTTHGCVYREIALLVGEELMNSNKRESNSV